MTDQNQATDWAAAWAALLSLDHDDDAFDDEVERLDKLWKAEYRTVFVTYALSRPDWTREDAELWCDDSVNDALVDATTYDTPAEAAKVDVLQCERETWHG